MEISNFNAAVPRVTRPPPAAEASICQYSRLVAVM